MRAYTFTENGFTFARVDKKQARKAYNNGLTVLFCPCNLRPGFPWFPEIAVNIKQDTDIGLTEHAKEKSFERRINAFEFYNCTDTETGKYTAFYIPVVMVDRFTGEKPTAATLGTVKQYDYSYMEG